MNNSGASMNKPDRLNSDGWDRSWDEFYMISDGNQYPEAPIVRFIANNFYNKERDRVSILDMGCGAAAHCWYLAREGFDTFGIDGSAVAIEKLKQRLRKENLEANLYVGDFSALVFDDCSFDAVIDGAAIQHNSPDRVNVVFSEVYRVLKKGGKYFGMLLTINNPPENGFGVTHFFSKNEIREYLKKFVNVTIDTLAYSENDGDRIFNFWLVEAQKPFQ